MPLGYRTPPRRIIVLGLGILAIAVTAFVYLATPPETPPLEAIHAKIAKEHPNIAHITADDLTDGRLAKSDIVMFDVREPGEFAVSHLRGATQVDPNLSAAAFLDRYGDKLAGKTVVFYCSVGVRSSKFAERVRSALAEPSSAGAGTPTRIANLTKGVFGWRNDGRLLSRGTEATDKVHPYDAYWGRLIRDPSAVAYTPKP